MSLETELGFRNPVTRLDHKALLSTYYTASQLRKKAGEFFRHWGLTDVQFNLMMVLAHQSGARGGLSQAALSEMLLVNRANITSLVDRMEKANLVERTTLPDDRRYNIVKLTPYGAKLLAEVEPLYAEEVRRVMAALSDSEQERLVSMLEKVRCNIDEFALAGDGEL